MKVKSEREVAQPCPTLSDPMDCSPPGSSVHGIFQARVLEWGAIAFSDRTWLPVNKNIHEACIIVFWWIDLTLTKGDQDKIQLDVNYSKAILLLDEADPALDFIKSNKTKLEVTLFVLKSDLPTKNTSQR